MAIGDVVAVDVGAATGVHSVDVGLFGLEAFGAVFVLDADRPTVVDTGAGTNHELILDALETVGVAPADLEVIAVTHVHLDHAGGAGFLARACPDAEVVVHEAGAPHLVDPTRLVEGTKRAVGDRWRHYAEPVPIPDDRVVAVADGDVLDLGDRTLDVHHAPGHAPHQVVYDDPAGGLVFVADAAGIYLPGPDAIQPSTPPPSFDLEGCLADLDTLRSLGPDGLCYPHFGAVPAAGRLDEYERVLTRWVEAVASAHEALGDEAAVVDRMVEATDFGTVWDEARARSEVALNVRGVLSAIERGNA